MTREPPNLTNQIEAVAWARRYAPETGKRTHMRDGEVLELMRRLEAALETLKTLEFGREIAR
jgi:hypothetical protein